MQQKNPVSDSKNLLALVKLNFLQQLDWIYPVLCASSIVLSSRHKLFLCLPQLFTFLIVPRVDDLTQIHASYPIQASRPRIVAHELFIVFYLFTTMFHAAAAPVRSGIWAWYALNGALLMATYGAAVTHEGAHIGGTKDGGRSAGWRLARLIDIILAISWGFGQYHFEGHHVRWAQPDDFDTAFYNESFYAFLRRDWLGNFLWRHRVDSYLCICVFHASVAVGWGPAAILFLLLQSFLTQVSFAANAYTQHYGLNRDKTYVRDGRALKAHAWNSPGWLLNAVLMYAGLHHEHHVEYYRKLKLESVPLDSGISILDAATLALWPSKWFSTMNPLIPVEIRLYATDPTDRGVRERKSVRVEEE